MHYIVREGKEKGKGRYWQQQPGPDPDPQPWVDGKRERPTKFLPEKAEVAEQVAEAWGGRVIRFLEPKEAKTKAVAEALRVIYDRLEKDFDGQEFDDILYRLYFEMTVISQAGRGTSREEFIVRRQQRREPVRTVPLLWALTAVVGEAAEVVKAVGKRLQYGRVNGEYKNDADLSYELDDLRGVLELLGERYPIFAAIRSRIINKKAKLLAELPREWEIHG